MSYKNKISITPQPNSVFDDFALRAKLLRSFRKPFPLQPQPLPQPQPSHPLKHEADASRTTRFQTTRNSIEQYLNARIKPFPNKFQESYSELIKIPQFTRKPRKKLDQSPRVNILKKVTKTEEVPQKSNDFLITTYFLPKPLITRKPYTKDYTHL